MRQVLEVIEPTKVSPVQASREERLRLETMGKRNNLVALFLQRQLSDLSRREDFRDLPGGMRHELNSFRSLAFDGLYPEDTALASMQGRLELYGGPVFDTAAGTVEDLRNFIETQEAYWKGQGYEGDMLAVHQDEDAANLLAKTEGGTVTVFGSARRGPDTPPYEAARWFTRMIVRELMQEDGTTERVASGAGPGVMEGANRGGREGLVDLLSQLQQERGNGESDHARCDERIRQVRHAIHSLGVRIQLPREAGWNPYLEQNLTMKKFGPRKRALVATTCGRSMDDRGDCSNWHGRHPLFAAFDGGFGTADETWETLCLEQCGKMPRIPFFIVGKDMGDVMKHALDIMEQHETISPEDRNIVTICDNEAEALERYLAHYNLPITPGIAEEIRTHTPFLYERPRRTLARAWYKSRKRIERFVMMRFS